MDSCFSYMLQVLGYGFDTDDSVLQSNVGVGIFQRWLGRKTVITEFVVEINKGSLSFESR